MAATDGSGHPRGLRSAAHGLTTVPGVRLLRTWPP
jgi:hypothetical protein